MTNKNLLLKEIVNKRQQSRWKGFRCLSDYHNGLYECDYVSPFTRSANNVNAKVLLVLQDWASDNFLKDCLPDPELIEMGHDPKLPTNKNLKTLLKDHFHLSLSDTYATNLFPFIKMGEMNAPISAKYLYRAAEEFTKPQIEIINPKIVICFGLATYNAVIYSYGLKPFKKIPDAIDMPVNIADGPVIFCQSHAGALGKANRNKGGVDRVFADWNKMKAFI